MSEMGYRLVEHKGGYLVYKGDEVYKTKIRTNIYVHNTAFGEVIVRSLNEDNLGVVEGYLCQFDRAQLVDIVEQLLPNDALNTDLYSLSENQVRELINIEDLMDESRFRKMLVAYAECGSICFPLGIAFYDVYDSFDPFLGYYGVGAFQSQASDMIEMWIDDIVGDDDDVDRLWKEYDEKYLADFLERYNAIFLPEDEEEREAFYDKYDCINASYIS